MLCLKTYQLKSMSKKNINLQEFKLEKALLCPHIYVYIDIRWSAFSSSFLKAVAVIFAGKQTQKMMTVLFQKIHSTQQCFKPIQISDVKGGLYKGATIPFC